MKNRHRFNKRICYFIARNTDVTWNLEKIEYQSQSFWKYKKISNFNNKWKEIKLKKKKKKLVWKILK